MKTSARKAKGRGLVVEVKQWLHRVFPWTTDHDVIVPATSASGADLVLSPQLTAVFPYSLEMKRQEGFSNVYRAFQQSQNNAHSGTDPIVIIRSNHQPALVVVSLSTFERLVK